LSWTFDEYLSDLFLIAFLMFVRNKTIFVSFAQEILLTATAQHYQSAA
jgi:hypothetical protein